MTGAQTQTLEAGIRAKTSPQRVVLRSRICLLAAEGLPHNAMAHRWETSRPTVRRWRTGFNEAEPLGSVRGCPAWASAHRLSPRKVRASVEATRCVETLTDVVGVDEQPQVHALDRTHPGVPRKKGRCGPVTHDDKPHRTTGLFAPRTVLDGTVIGPCDPRHRHEEWLKFLPVIDRDTSPGQALHVILDNDGRTTTPRSRSGWRDFHDFICTLRRQAPRD